MRSRLLLILTFATLSFGSTHAFAADVVLVHPASADPFIEEIYHRVRGELRAQAISFEQEEGGASALSEPASQVLLERSDARACISFNWQGEATVIRVWAIEEVGKPARLLEAVALKRNDEAPTLLATRAVDLLRAAVRRPERAPQPEPPPAPVPAPLPAPRPAEEVRAWSIAAAVSGLDFPARVGQALGPELSVEHRTSTRLSVGVDIAAPLLGASVENSQASARLAQGLAAVKLSAQLLRFGPLRLSADGGAGVHFLRASGSLAEGVGSLAARREQRLSLGLLAGTRGAWELSSRVSLVLGVSALVLIPAPQIALGRERIHLGELGLQWCAGLQFAL